MTAPADRLRTRLGSLELANPVLTASGTFGNGPEYAQMVECARLGAIVTKSVTRDPTRGNPPPRVAETPAGMLNAVGLQNEGVEAFCEEILPQLRQTLEGSAARAATGGPDAPPTRVIASVAGKRADEYAAVTERLGGESRVDALEINISCPNVKEGGLAFGARAQTAEALVGELRKLTPKPMLVKLSPNVTDIAEVARATEAAGADALVVANTLLGMAVDVRTRRPVLANITGGLSGPAVRPVALRLVWQTHRAVRIPVVGVGGVASAEDAVAFLLCGASAVEIGTMNFVEPGITERVVDGLAKWMTDEGETVDNLVGALRT
jgi:dihydroorotate dehydrogenase (NAD+) catalytic subunit